MLKNFLIDFALQNFSINCVDIKFVLQVVRKTFNFVNRSKIFAVFIKMFFPLSCECIPNKTIFFAS